MYQAFSAVYQHQEGYQRPVKTLDTVEQMKPRKNIVDKPAPPNTKLVYYTDWPAILFLGALSVGLIMGLISKAL